MSVRLKAIFLVLCAVLMLFTMYGCTQVSDEEPMYVYGIGMDMDEKNTDLYVLIGKNEENGQKSDGKSSNNGDKESENSENGKQVDIICFQGDSVDEVMDALFEEYEDLYTGTVGIYVLNEDMSENGIMDFKVYLTNSNKLPAKRDTLMHSDPYGYLSDNSEQLMKK